MRKQCEVAGLVNTNLRLNAYFELIASMVVSRDSSWIMYRFRMSSLHLSHSWSLRMRRIDLGNGSEAVPLVLEMGEFRIIARGC